MLLFIKVSDINQAIVDARDVNDVGRAAVLRITLKDAERMYVYDGRLVICAYVCNFPVCAL